MSLKHEEDEMIFSFIGLAIITLVSVIVSYFTYWIWFPFWLLGALLTTLVGAYIHDRIMYYKEKKMGRVNEIAKPDRIKLIHINLNKKEWEGRLHIEAFFSEIKGTRLLTFAVFVLKDGKPSNEIIWSFSGSFSNSNLLFTGIPNVSSSLKREMGNELAGALEDAFRHIEEESIKIIRFPKLANSQ